MAEAVRADFVRLLKRSGGRGEFGYVLRNAPQPQVGLDFDRDDPAIKTRKEGLSGFGGVVALGNLYQFGNPLRQRQLMTEWRCERTDSGAVRILGGRDVGRDGHVAAPREESMWGQPPEHFHVAVGDVLIRSMYAPGYDGGLILATVKSEDLPAAAVDSVLILQPREDLSALQADFAMRFLRTPLALTLLNRRRVTVTRQGLAQLVVPQPDEDLADALDGLTVVKERLEHWRAQADDILGSVFLDENPVDARARVIESGRTLRMRVEAGSLLDDLGYTVRTRFPYPVAARWRMAEALQSAAPSMEAYGAILDTTEILLCYGALLALALTREAGVELGSANDIRTKLRGGRTGPGMGEWVAVLNELATSRRLRSLTPSNPLGDLRSMLAEKDVEAARQRLTQRRNDEAHMRGVDPIDLPDAVHEAGEDLRRLLEAARFLTDWPLVHVTGVRWDSLIRTSYVEYRELMGDHPIVPTSSEHQPNSELEVGSLYLRGHERRLHLLRPFLVGRPCPVCRTWSTFHIDRAPKGTVVLKSLEHGHICEDRTLVDAARIGGVL
ncbi:hypothetical protein ACQP0C_27695 [Nocardia sp. CA-129566]|uniref:hypothetical protein n=1 Tax=Nocardia sp. CA-129566 TaxID=3239976 RepID=UPI003D951978